MRETTTTTIAQEIEEDPISVFLYALKAPETRRQYPRRLKVFLDYLKLEGTLEQQAKGFLSKAKGFLSPICLLMMLVWQCG